MRKPPKTPDKIDPNAIRVRDHLLVGLILGRTKAGVQPDRKKHADKMRCRGKFREEE